VGSQLNTPGAPLLRFAVAPSGTSMLANRARYQPTATPTYPCVSRQAFSADAVATGEGRFRVRHEESTVYVRGASRSTSTSTRAFPSHRDYWASGGL
jgi:hypothetical protein